MAAMVRRGGWGWLLVGVIGVLVGGGMQRYVGANAALAPQLWWETRHLSVNSAGHPADRSSTLPSISHDGRFVVFSSTATNLVAGESNSHHQVYLHDRLTLETSRVSRRADGTMPLSNHFYPVISGNGRYVAFTSGSSDLDPHDENGHEDVYVYDRQTQQTSLVSVASDRTQANAMSASASISDDGRVVAFHTNANNLVPGESDTLIDVFVHDRMTGETVRASQSSDGTVGNGDSFWSRISGNGRYVVFTSEASNLVPGDTNHVADIFQHDLLTRQTRRVSVASDGTQANDTSRSPTTDATGRYIAFVSRARNLDTNPDALALNVFLHDAETGETRLVGIGAENVYWSSPALSPDGRYLAFSSPASTLVAGDTNGHADVFVVDLLLNRTVRASIASDGSEGNEWSGEPALSANGVVVFSSLATTFFAGDTNYGFDIFAHIREPGYERLYLPLLSTQ